jgi:hypothetical protein
MHNDLGDFGISSTVDHSPETLQKVKASAPEGKSPTFVTDAMIPKKRSGKRTIRFGCISDKTSCSMRIEGEQEHKCEVMCIPECFEGLLADWGMSSRVHEQHAQQHDMPSDPTRFSVMDLNGSNWSRTHGFDILRLALIRRMQSYEKVYVVCRRVKNGEQKEHVSRLSMKPKILVERKESNLWTQKSNQVSTYRKHDQESINDKNESCSTRCPYTVLERVQQRKPLILLL